MLLGTVLGGSALYDQRFARYCDELAEMSVYDNDKKYWKDLKGLVNSLLFRSLEHIKEAFKEFNESTSGQESIEPKEKDKFFYKSALNCYVVRLPDYSMNKKFIEFCLDGNAEKRTTWLV